MRIILVSLFILALSYFYTDRQLFFYGKSDFKVFGPLPLNVKPEYWGYNRGNLGFVFADQYDFTIVKRGLNSYRDSEVFVKDIIKYGFDQKRVIVAVADSLGSEHFIALESGDKPEIKASIDAKIDFRNISWIEVKGKEGYVKTVEWIRSFIRIGLFILVVVIVVRGVKVAMLHKTSRPAK
jgi:hypothetical protein